METIRIVPLSVARWQQCAPPAAEAGEVAQVERTLALASLFVGRLHHGKFLGDYYFALGFI